MPSNKNFHGRITAATFEAGTATPADPLSLPGVLILSIGAARGHYAVSHKGRLVNYDGDNPDHAGLEAFPIMIDHVMLQQVVDSAKSRDTVKAKLNHGRDAGAIFGGYSRFRVEGDHVRADLRFLENSPHSSYIREIAEMMSSEFGNSIDFDYAYEFGEMGGKKIALARCKKLSSVDVVDCPAATSGLFETPETTPPANMLTPEDLAAIADLINSKIEPLQTAIAAMAPAAAPVPGEAELEEKKPDDKKELVDETELSARIAKTVIAQFATAFPKIGGPVKLGNHEVPDKALSPWQQAVKTELDTGATSRGMAVQFAARKHPKLYNEACASGTI